MLCGRNWAKRAGFKAFVSTKPERLHVSIPMPLRCGSTISACITRSKRKCVYKAYARGGAEWGIRGVRGSRKKTDGTAEMVSPFQNKERGIRLPLSEDNLAAVNEFRQRKGRTAYEATLGTRFLLPGKNREGYWGFAEFDEQVIDAMDCIEVLEPNRQIAIEVDHSVRHAKYLPEGLHMANMNAKYGGKQRALRDSVMTGECLSPGNATMYLNITMYLNGRVQILSPSSQQE